MAATERRGGQDATAAGNLYPASQSGGDPFPPQPEGLWAAFGAPRLLSGASHVRMGENPGARIWAPPFPAPLFSDFSASGPRADGRDFVRPHHKGFHSGCCPCEKLRDIFGTICPSLCQTLVGACAGDGEPKRGGRAAALTRMAFPLSRSHRPPRRARRSERVVAFSPLCRSAEDLWVRCPSES